MENEGQTAVEWFAEKLKSQGLLIGEPLNLVAFQQAKEMEKEQKELENDKGWSKGWDEAVKEYEKNR